MAPGGAAFAEATAASEAKRAADAHAAAEANAAAKITNGAAVACVTRAAKTEASSSDESEDEYFKAATEFAAKRGAVKERAERRYSEMEALYRLLWRRSGRIGGWF